MHQTKFGSQSIVTCLYIMYFEISKRMYNTVYIYCILDVYTLV